MKRRSKRRRINGVARWLRFVSLYLIALALIAVPIEHCRESAIGTNIATVCSTLSETVIENAIEETVIEEAVITEPESTTPYYTVNGAFLGYELSDYLYEQLESRGIEWFYEYALCQLYQESRFKADATGPDGYDQGIAQLRVVYWDYFVEIAGLEEADPYDPYDSIYIYCHLMNKYLRAVDGDILRAYSYYNVGNTKRYNEKYVNAVMQWYDTIEVMQ